MTDHMQTIRDDLAYLRAMAEEGRDGGHRGGAIGVAAGLIYAACSVCEWAALTGRASQAIANDGWLGGTALFLCVVAFVKITGGASTGRARAANIAWIGVGWAIFALCGALTVASWKMQSALLIFFFPSIIFALYGAAWTVAALVTKKLWMSLTAAGSFLATVACAWFIKDPVQYLIYAAGLLLLAALPSAVMMRQQPSRSEA
jgi:hypothetical protein